jgi:hypothetical protein
MPNHRCDPCVLRWSVAALGGLAMSAAVLPEPVAAEMQIGA